MLVWFISVYNLLAYKVYFVGFIKPLCMQFSIIKLITYFLVFLCFQHISSPSFEKKKLADLQLQYIDQPTGNGDQNVAHSYYKRSNEKHVGGGRACKCHSILFLSCGR